MNAFMTLLGEAAIGVIVGCLLVVIIAATIKEVKKMMK